GSITVSSSGGTGMHTYSINGVDFQSSPTFAGLGAGNYTITVRDSLECTDDIMATVTGTSPDMTQVDTTLCEGDSITFNGEIFNSTGIYMITFTGSDGCDSIVTLDLLVESC